MRTEPLQRTTPSLSIRDELEPVTERIIDVSPRGAFECAVFTHLAASRAQPLHKVVEPPNPQRRMRLPRREELDLHAQVQPHSGLAFEPATSARGKLRGLRDLAHPQQVAVKPTRGILPAGRHGKLDVVDADEPHAGARYFIRRWSARLSRSPAPSPLASIGGALGPTHRPMSTALLTL